MCDRTINLPPGFQFLPTDEELVLHFLYPKASLLPCHPNIIPELNPQLYDPWQLNGLFFSPLFILIWLISCTVNL